MSSEPVIESEVVISPGVTIGEGALVRSGSVVHANVPPHTIVEGDPARIVGSTKPGLNIADAASQVFRGSDVSDIVHLPGGASLHRLGYFKDLRGELIFGCGTTDLPFEPVRFFVTNVSSGQTVRGEHAHRTLLEFLVPINGSVKVAIEIGPDCYTVHLNENSVGLLLPTFCWSCQFDFEEGTSLLVLASEPYKEESYIRDYLEFKQLSSAAG